MGNTITGCARAFIARTLLSSALGALLVTAHAGPMDIGGQFAVSESGAATYSVPISAPPGVAGIEPKLTFNYNSQAGNGLLGVGWSVSGLSAIARCPRTIAQDGVHGSVKLDANDRFCLDGQRLILVSGTYGSAGSEYRTERDGFSKIVANSGTTGDPTWFKVWTKSGQIFEFGNTSDSRIEAQGKTQARLWALNKISDTKGNDLTVSYTEITANSEFYPSRIDYSGNANAGTAPNNSLQFTYEARPDPSKVYGAGFIQVNNRLSQIQAYNGTTQAYAYKISYDQSPLTNKSRLTGIKRCAADGVTCTAAYSATWLNGTVDFSQSQFIPISITGFSPNNYSNKVFLYGDVNLDGIPDMVWVWNNGNTLGRVIWYGKTDGTFNATYDSYITETGFTPSTYTNQNYSLADANKDGIVDLVWTWVNSGTLGRVIWYGKANGTFGTVKDSYVTQTWSGASSYTNQRFFLTDVTRDGREDLVWVWNSGNTLGRVVWQGKADGTFSTTQDYYATQTGFSPSTYANQQYFVQDINADGEPDLVWVWNSGNTLGRVVWQGKGGGTFGATHDSYVTEAGFTASIYTNQSYFLNDVNGDGVPDLTWAWTYETMTAGRVVWLGLGDGQFSKSSFVQEPNFHVGYTSGWLTKDTKYMSMDINNDGRSDLILTWTSTCNLCGPFQIRAVWYGRSDGSFGATYASGAALGMIFSNPIDSPFAQVDLSGNGALSLIRNIMDQMTNQYGIHKFSPFDSLSDLILVHKPGLGSQVEVQYQPLTRSSVFTKSTGSVYPVQDILAPMYVVSQVKGSNGVGGVRTSNYTYGGLKGELGTGRGLLGFAWMQTTDADSGVSVKTEYRQDWPYTGLPSKVTTTQSSASGPNQQLSQVVNTYGCLDPATGAACTVAAGNRYFPYLSQSVDSRWDLNGAALPTTTTTNSFDSYGNATSVGVSSSDGYSKTTTSTYSNDTTNWFLGRLLKAQVQSVTP